MTHRNETLSEQIEQLVRAHIEVTRREASEAVTRAFASAFAAPRASTAPRPTRAIGRRRGAAALSALGERLCEAVRAQPGETMAVLAPELGCSPRSCGVEHSGAAVTHLHTAKPHAFPAASGGTTLAGSSVVCW